MTNPTDGGAGGRCPACGKPATGTFCGDCGAPLGTTNCRQCQKPVPAGNRFCPNCGTQAGTAGGPARLPTPARAPQLLPWGLGAALLAALIWLVVRNPTPPAAAPEGTGSAPAGAPAAGGAPPDISNMSPRERFMRLYDRIITAAQTGDQKTVEQFTPMALSAYSMLEKVDADARYHLAMLQLHVGNVPGAQALADTIQKKEPEHLFGWVIAGAVARFTKDDQARNAAYRKFLDRYEAEMKKGLPEYAEHNGTLVELKKTAEGAVGKK